MARDFLLYSTMRLFLLLIFIPVYAWADPNPPLPGASDAYYRYVVATLAHDSMKGRLPGTAEEKKSACFIAGEFSRAGCKPIKRKRFFYPFTYFDPDSTLTHAFGNVIAKVNTSSAYCIVVTAHYDHIGFGKHHSNDPFNNTVYNGADDNASGIAVLLSLAAWCNEHRNELKYDIVFAALSGEEDGLYGSLHFLNSRIVDTSKIICNINLDMVGHLDAQRPLLIAEGAPLHRGWDSVLPRDTTRFFVVQRTRVLVPGGSDHCTFLDAGIPAVLFSTGITGYYHRPTDEMETINFPGMLGINEYLVEVLAALNKRKDAVELFR